MTAFCLAACMVTVARPQTIEPPSIQEPVPIECLWSANETTWAALGLQPKEVERLEEIRNHYPPPLGDPSGPKTTPKRTTPDTKDDPRIHTEPDPLRRPHPSAVPPPSGNVETVPASPEPSEPGKGDPKDLQEELRGVLSPEQLVKWRELCKWQKPE